MTSGAKAGLTSCSSTPREYTSAAGEGCPLAPSSTSGAVYTAVSRRSVCWLRGRALWQARWQALESCGGVGEQERRGGGGAPFEAARESFLSLSPPALQAGAPQAAESLFERSRTFAVNGRLPHTWLSSTRALVRSPWAKPWACRWASAAAISCSHASGRAASAWQA